MPINAPQYVYIPIMALRQPVVKLVVTFFKRFADINRLYVANELSTNGNIQTLLWYEYDTTDHNVGTTQDYTADANVNMDVANQLPEIHIDFRNVEAQNFGAGIYGSGEKSACFSTRFDVAMLYFNSCDCQKCRMWVNTGQNKNIVLYDNQAQDNIIVPGQTIIIAGDNITLCLYIYGSDCGMGTRLWPVQRDTSWTYIDTQWHVQELTKTSTGDVTAIWADETAPSKAAKLTFTIPSGVSTITTLSILT